MNANMEWMNDPSLLNIPIQKLQFLQNMLFESKKHTGKEMLPFFMSLAMKAKSQSISFTDEEINLIIPVLKKFATEDEIKQMNQVIQIFKNQKKQF